MAKPFLLAYPNPYIAIDHEGCPAGACPCDMPEHVGMTSRRYVGAELDRESTVLLEKLSSEELGYRNARQRTRFVFNFAEPSRLPDTPYYRDRFRDGEILAADEATARTLGLLKPGEKFTKPADALRAAKDRALKEWERHHGKGERPEFLDMLDDVVAAIDAAPKPTASAALMTKGDK